MIRIFREVREYAISGNKLRKYTMYALGEIVLVVIGILLALQIDQMKEQTKQDAEEIRILTDLKEDLTSDISQLKTNILNAKGRQLKIDSVFDILSKPNNVKVNHFLELNFAIAIEDHFDLNSGYFDESISSGNINFIKQDSIRKQIFDYYRVTKINYTDNNTIKQIYENIIPQFFKTFVPSKEFIGGFLNKPTILPSLDVEALALDKDYISILTLKYRTEHHQILSWEKYLKSAQSLSGNIEKELKRLH